MDNMFPRRLVVALSALQWPKTVTVGLKGAISREKFCKEITKKDEHINK